MKAGVVTFPGSNCDQDVFNVLDNIFDFESDMIWHKEKSLNGYDLIVLPGGFSYGDYLRSGAIARFANIMDSVIDYANQGGLVLGICNGFQILLEAGLIPGAMMHNAKLKFVCKNVYIRTESTDSVFTSGLEKGQILDIPVSHGEGNYFIEDDGLKSLQDNDQILFRYCNENGELTEEANFNGSVDHIAGIVNKERNVLGMMPHPERAMEKLLGSEDGRPIFESILNSLSVA